MTAGVPAPSGEHGRAEGDEMHFADHGVAGGFPHPASACEPADKDEQRSTVTGRTTTEEQVVTWDYYLGMAIVAAERDPARDMLLANGYDIAQHLRSLKGALGWPTPPACALDVAGRALHNGGSDG